MENITLAENSTAQKSNIERPTSNFEFQRLCRLSDLFDVQCSVFDVQKRTGASESFDVTAY